MGPIEYYSTGEGPPVVLLHGLVMNHRLWDQTLPHLPEGFTYLRPILPLGAHEIPMNPGADLTLPGQVHIVAEFLRVLDLRQATVVVADWGGPLLLPSYGLAQRVSRYVICPCEAFDNFPPGLPGRMAVAAARVPGGLTLALNQMRSSLLRRSPLFFGGMAARPLSDDLVQDWTDIALMDPDILGDLRAYLRGPVDRAELVRRTEALSGFRGEALVVWNRSGRVIPPEHGPRLAGLIPRSRLTHVDGASVLVMTDEPRALAAEIASFLHHAG
jgi:pimeloyl-ACP methyl ester carboxylesterase